MRLPLISRNFFGANGLVLALIAVAPSVFVVRFERKAVEIMYANKICTSLLILSQKPSCSAAAELRRSLGQKRGDTFLRICAARHVRDRFVLEFHLLVERIGGRAVQQTFHPSVSARGAVGQFIGHRFRLRDQLIVWHYPRD